MFAPAEKFAEMLEETGASRFKVGTAHDVSNKDNAGMCLFYINLVVEMHILFHNQDNCFSTSTINL